MERDKSQVALTHAKRPCDRSQDPYQLTPKTLQASIASASLKGFSLLTYKASSLFNKSFCSDPFPTASGLNWSL